MAKAVFIHGKGAIILYIYPENMTAKAMLWLWTLKDLSISGSLLLVGFFLFAQFGSYPMLVAGAVYAFLTIRFDDVSILDYLRHASRFCFAQQFFLWGRPPAESGKTQKKKRKRVVA